MGAQGGEKGRDAFEKAIVDDALVFEGFDVLFALEAFLVNLVLFGTDKGAFIDVRVDLDIGVIAELEVVLGDASVTLFYDTAVEEDAASLPICCSRSAC